MNDDALIRDLFIRHRRSLLAYVTKLTGDYPQAEDIVQETLLRAWGNADVLVNGRGSVRGWLLTVARNIAIDQARARAARPEEATESLFSPPAEPDHAEQVVESAYIDSVLRCLPAEHRAVLARVYLQGATVKEAAESLGIPEGTAKSRIHYGLRALRDSVDRDQPINQIQ